jgi:threonine dehydratase
MGGDPIWVKAESLQRTGSFKLRGAANAIAALEDGRKGNGVVTYSAGNHGKALAYAARAAGIAATVVMPETASPVKIQHTRSQGASVVLRPPDDIVRHARDIAADGGPTLVPPFDDAWVIAGQGTVGLELLDQVDIPDVVLVPVGGGGLIAGVATAVKGLRPGARVIAVEPEHAGDLAAGFALGERVTWPRQLTGRTIADGLRSPAVGALPWRHIMSLVDDVVTVSEQSITVAMRWLAENAGLVVEPSGAVATAALVEHSGALDGRTIVSLATGGNIDLETFVTLVAG